MDRSRYSTFIGVDLGGARGKSTAVAELSSDADRHELVVDEVHTRGAGGAPWTDALLFDFLAGLDAARTVVAVAAPMTVPACLRCQLEACPGYQACADPATAWLRTVGEELQQQAFLSDRDRIAAIPASTRFTSRGVGTAPAKQRIAPYTHRCTEVLLHYTRDLVPREQLGQSPGPIASRAAHLRRVLAGRGYGLNDNLLEVSPRGTVHALFGPGKARGYKRDADPWETRAAIVEDLRELEFSPKSRLSREEVLRNDHCFDALLSGYTAYLWARDGWSLPEDAAPFAADGWIWTPPDR